jgi:hypothetical protein
MDVLSRFFLSVPITAIMVGLTLSGCVGVAETQDQNIVTTTGISPSPSATIIWFPPSATPLSHILPLKEATPEQKPGLGGVILRDNFSSPADWNTAVSDQAAVDISNHQMSIAVQPGIYAVSLRQKIIFGDFYLEITARPSLCRASDQYGLLFRAPNNVAYYRFVLSCAGTVSFDRWSVKTPHLLQPAISSGDVPPGAPGEVRLGVWADGPEFHLFLNDHFQFSVLDKNYRTGSVGVFAVSTGATPVTVAFSDLAVYDVVYSLPTTTPLP